MPLYVDHIVTTAELAPLAGDWNRLAGDVPMRRWEWLASWWETFGQAVPEAALCVLAVRDERQRLVGLAPWYRRWSQRWPRQQVLAPLGSGEVCSDYLTILALPAAATAVADALADWLIAAQHSVDTAWDALELEAFVPDDPVTRGLLSRLAANSHEVYRRPGPPCWRIELPATWDEYLQMLSKSHRKQLRRAERVLAERSRWKLHRVSHETELAPALAALAQLHVRRQQSLGHLTALAAPRFQQFLALVAERMLRAGKLHLWILSSAGRPVAVEYQLAGEQTVFAYQAGIDPAHLADEPGRLITLSSLRAALTEGYRGFDFLRGNEPYKAHWRARPRPSDDLRVVTPQAARRLSERLWTTGDQVRHWLKDNLASLVAPGT